jgi:putative acetyltransferase
MIREFQQSDIDQVISIWLKASIEAHDFVDSEFWRSKARDMREVYISSGETYVYEVTGIIKGFASLCQDTIATMFVSPDSHRRGIGTELMEKAKDVRHGLTFTVYGSS